MFDNISQHTRTLLLLSANEVWEGNVFTGVFLSTGGIGYTDDWIGHMVGYPLSLPSLDVGPGYLCCDIGQTRHYSPE